METPLTLSSPADTQQLCRLELMLSVVTLLFLRRPHHVINAVQGSLVSCPPFELLWAEMLRQYDDKKEADHMEIALSVLRAYLVSSTSSTSHVYGPQLQQIRVVACDQVYAGFMHHYNKHSGLEQRHIQPLVDAYLLFRTKGAKGRVSLHSSFMPSARLGIYARLGDQSALDGLKFISYGLEWTRGEPESTVDTAVRAIKRKVKVVSGKTGSIRDASTPVDHDRLLEENNISQRSLSESADKEVKTLLLGPLAWVNSGCEACSLLMTGPNGETLVWSSTQTERYTGASGRNSTRNDIIPGTDTVELLWDYGTDYWKDDYELPSPAISRPPECACQALNPSAVTTDPLVVDIAQASRMPSDINVDLNMIVRAMGEPAYRPSVIPSARVPEGDKGDIKTIWKLQIELMKSLDHTRNGSVRYLDLPVPLFSSPEQRCIRCDADGTPCLAPTYQRLNSTVVFLPRDGSDAPASNQEVASTFDSTGTQAYYNRIGCYHCLLNNQCCELEGIHTRHASGDWEHSKFRLVWMNKTSAAVTELSVANARKPDTSFAPKAARPSKTTDTRVSPGRMPLVSPSRSMGSGADRPTVQEATTHRTPEPFVDQDENLDSPRRVEATSATNPIIASWMPDSAPAPTVNDVGTLLIWGAMLKRRAEKDKANWQRQLSEKDAEIAELKRELASRTSATRNEDTHMAPTASIPAATSSKRSATRPAPQGKQAKRRKADK